MLYGLLGSHCVCDIQCPSASSPAVTLVPVLRTVAPGRERERERQRTAFVMCTEATAHVDAVCSAVAPHLFGDPEESVGIMMPLVLLLQQTVDTHALGVQE
eukprot:5034902-Amphidinium_carterae.1